MSSHDPARRTLLAGLVTLLPVSALAASPGLGARASAGDNAAAIRGLVDVARRRMTQARAIGDERARGLPQDRRQLASRLGGAFAAVGALDAVSRLPVEAQATPHVQDLLHDLATSMGEAMLEVAPWLEALAERDDVRGDELDLDRVEADLLAQMPAGRGRRRTRASLARLRRRLQGEDPGSIATDLLGRLQAVGRGVDARLHPVTGAAAMGSPTPSEFEEGKFGQGGGEQAAAFEALLAAADAPGGEGAAIDPELARELETPRQHRIATRITLIGAQMIGLGVVSGGLMIAAGAASLSGCVCLGVMLILVGVSLLGGLGGTGVGMVVRARKLESGVVPDLQVVARIPVTTATGWRPTGFSTEQHKHYHCDVVVVDTGNLLPDGPAGDPTTDAPASAPYPGGPLGAVVLRAGGKVAVADQVHLRLGVGPLEVALNVPPDGPLLMGSGTLLLYTYRV